MPYDTIFALLLNAFFSEMPKSAFLFNVDAQIGKIADFVFNQFINGFIGASATQKTTNHY